MKDKFTEKMTEATIKFSRDLEEQLFNHKGELILNYDKFEINKKCNSDSGVAYIEVLLFYKANSKELLISKEYLDK